VRFFLAALIALCGLSVASAQPRGSAREAGVLVIGRISEDPRTVHQSLKPLLDYVVARMADLGIHRGEVLMAPSDAVMRSYLRTGLVDWVSETPAQALRLEPAGAKPILVTERRGRATYRTVFFTRRESGIRSLADLQGRRLAVQHEFSTSAYVVPLGLLLEKGLRLALLPSPRAPVPEGSVGFVLARSEHNIAAWVHKGLAEAGAFSDVDFHGLDRFPVAMRPDLVVFHEGPPMPRGLELIRGDLRPEVARRLREVLLAAPGDPEAAPALAAFGGVSAFHPVDEDTRRSLDRIGALLARLRSLDP
jgi:phosphonate transport system substrate-binding protein